MKNTLVNLGSSAVISLIVVLPFMILEVVNRRAYKEGFPSSLFVILWLLPLAFMLILMPMVRQVRAGNSLMANPISLLLRVALLTLIA